MTRALLIVAAVAGVLAQSPAFEVASVKRNRSGEERSRFDTPANRFVATNVELYELIAWAFGDPGPPPELRPNFQISGGPAWISSDRFDVEATTGRELPDGVERTRLKMRMLQTLLAERFKVSVHHETRDGPIYSLVLANRDRRLGPKLRRSDVDCNALFARGRAGAAPPPPPPPPGQVPQCGIRVGLSSLSFGSQSVPAMARLLERAVGRPVVDRTALEGLFDLILDFDPTGLPGANRPPGVAVPDTSDKPSLYTALQEQAGLKLEAGRGPIDVLVIESAEHPVEN